MNEYDRIEKLLALHLLRELKGESDREKTLQLNLAGFSNLEIADLLDTNTQVIRNYLSGAGRTRARPQNKPKQRIKN